MSEESHKKKLVEYFKKNIEKKYNADTLKFALIKQGYSRVTVNLALDQAKKELAEKNSFLKEKPVIKYEVLDEHDRPVIIKKPWWKRLLGID